MRLFSRHANNVNPDNETDLVFQRQKNRSCTKRKRRVSEQQYQARLSTIRNEPNRVHFSSIEQSGDVKPDKKPSLSVPEEEAVVASTASPFDLPDETIVTDDEEDATRRDFMKTFKRRTCRFSSGRLINFVILL